MKRIIIIIFLLLIQVNALNTKSKFIKLLNKAKQNETIFYTKYNFFIQNNIIHPGNYIMGNCLPINSKIKINKVSRLKIRFTVKLSGLYFLLEG